MDDEILVHVVNTITNLSHKEDAVPFCESEVVSHHTLKQLTPGYAVDRNILSALLFLFCLIFL